MIKQAAMMDPFQLNKKHRGHEFLIGCSWTGLLGKHREQKTKSCLTYLSSTSGHQSHRLTPNSRTVPFSKCTGLSSGSTGKPACKSAKGQHNRKHTGNNSAVWFSGANVVDDKVVSLQNPLTRKGLCMGVRYFVCMFRVNKGIQSPTAYWTNWKYIAVPIIYGEVSVDDFDRVI